MPYNTCMRSLMMLVLVLLAVGCSPTVKTVSVIGGGIESPFVEEAIQRWSLALGGEYAITFVENDAHADIVIRTAEFPGTTKCGYTADVDGQAVLGIDTTSDRCKDKDLVNILTHEIGHALGAGHSKNRGDVMYESIQTGVWDPTAHDVELVHKNGGDS